MYWKTGAQAHTAVLDLPAGDPARPRPLARTVGRCKPPRKGARLVARSPRIVVTSAGADVWLCRAGKTRRLRNVSDMAIEVDQYVRYRRADTIVLVDVATNQRQQFAAASEEAVGDDGAREYLYSVDERGDAGAAGDRALSCRTRVRARPGEKIRDGSRRSAVAAPGACHP